MQILSILNMHELHFGSLSFCSLIFYWTDKKKISFLHRNSTPHIYWSANLDQCLRPLGHPSILDFKCKSGVYEVTMTFCNRFFGLPTLTVCNSELIELSLNYIHSIPVYKKRREFPTSAIFFLEFQLVFAS